MKLVSQRFETIIWHKLERRVASWSRRKPGRLSLDKGAVSFTFDDVAQSACRQGRDILERYDCRGTYFVCGALTGLHSSAGPFHTLDDLVSLKRSGHELGCHGFSHHNYQSLSREQMKDDIVANRLFFQDRLKCSPPSNFAYPFGCVSRFIKSLIGEEYYSARGGRNRLNDVWVDLNLLCSIPLYERLWTAPMLTRLIHKAVERQAWLIFVTHEVAKAPSEFGCTPALLQFAIQHAKQVGLPILPLNDVLLTVTQNAPNVAPCR